MMPSPLGAAWALCAFAARRYELALWKRLTDDAFSPSASGIVEGTPKTHAVLSLAPGVTKRAADSYASVASRA